MSGQIKLHYFDIAALGEPIKFMLYYGGMKFTDIRIPTIEEFQKIKETFPYAKVPVLEIDGKILHQTRSICRYLAGKLNLLGKTESDVIECEMIVDTIEDLRGPMNTYYYEKNAEAKAVRREQLFSTLIPYYVNKLETHVARNGGHFVNGQLTWADFYFAGVADYMCDYLAGEDIFAGKTALNTLRNKIKGFKGIKEYLPIRPPMTLN